MSSLPRLEVDNSSDEAKPAHCLFSHSSRAKNGFVFLMVENQKRDNIL